MILHFNIKDKNSYCYNKKDDQLCRKSYVQCELKKRKPKFNTKSLSKKKRQIIKLLSRDDSIFIFLSFDTSYKMYWPCMNKHWPFQMVMSKIICAEWEFKGLTGSATFQNKGTCWKTFIGISFVSFVMFLLLRLLILTWISESELGHITQHHYSAQNRFWHAWV